MKRQSKNEVILITTVNPLEKDSKNNTKYPNDTNIIVLYDADCATNSLLIRVVSRMIHKA
jgi:hypothetical protein